MISFLGKYFLNLALRLKLSKQKKSPSSRKETDFHFQIVLIYVIYNNQAGLDHTVSVIIYWTKIEFYWSE